MFYKHTFPAVAWAILRFESQPPVPVPHCGSGTMNSYTSALRRLLLGVCLLLLITANAFADVVDTLWLGNDGWNSTVQEVRKDGTVVRSFTPGTITGIAINPATNTLYLGQHSESGNPSRIQLRDLTTLASMGTLSQSPGPAWGEDLAFDGTNLYRADYYGSNVWKIDTSTGAATSLIAGLSGPVGVAWDGTHLWVSEIGTLRVARYTAAGSLVAGSEFTPSLDAGDRAGGLAFDTSDNTLWLGSDQTVYHLAVSGSVLGSFEATAVLVDGLEFQAAALPLDADGDGVLDEDDACSDTVIPESVPAIRLGVNRFALTAAGDGFTFDTTAPPGKGQGPQRSFTIDDTAGCSCEQIIEQLGLGEGHNKFGCSISAMEDWIARVNP